jgi:hypothetical protein
VVAVYINFSLRIYIKKNESALLPHVDCIFLDDPFSPSHLSFFENCIRTRNYSFSVLGSTDSVYSTSKLENNSRNCICAYSFKNSFLYLADKLTAT